MLRPNIRNRTFDWMGEKFAPIIDRHHFLGRSSLDPVWGKKKPFVNIFKEGKMFEMEVAIPGYNKKEITVTIADDILVIKGERKKIKDISNSVFLLKEFEKDAFERQFRLAKNIGHEKVKAKYKNGILKIKFYDVPAAEEVVNKTVEVA